MPGKTKSSISFAAQETFIFEINYLQFDTPWPIPSKMEIQPSAFRYRWSATSMPGEILG